MTQPLDTYCLTCRYALDRWRTTDAEGGNERIAWLHTHAWDGPEHEPVPVPLIELTKANLTCDFCSGRPVTTSFRFDHLVIKIPGLSYTSDYGIWWASCAHCEPFVMAKNIDGLVLRVSVAFGMPGAGPRYLYSRLLPTLREQRAVNYEQG